MADREEREAAAPVKVLTGLGRAGGGALIFGLPMLMTMEFWELGGSMERYRLVLLIVLSLPLLVGIAHRVGFEATFGWREDVRDAGIALGIAVLASAGVLAALGVLRSGSSAGVLVGQVAVQTVPAAIGALLARSQLAGGAGGEDANGNESEKGRALAGWAGTLFLMLVGALFLSLNVAPTEEMVLISYMMTPWHALVLVALSIAIMHAFVYALAFRGGEGAGSHSGWSRFLRFTLVGYVVCLAISLYVLWTFGRLDALAATPAAMATVVLAFPAAVGAAAARLIL